MAAAAVPVRFVGSVDALEGLVPLPPSRRRDITVEVRGTKGARLDPRVLTAPAGPSWTTVRLLLPDDTPPGEYEATVGVEDERFAALVQVPARPRVFVVPATLEADVSPDGSATVSVVVANSGNTPVVVPRTVAVGLFDVGGLDRAIGEGLTTDAGGVDRLGAVADSLAGNHGGLLRIAVRSGAGTVGPGESRTLTCELRPSGRVVEGRSYFGYWPLADVTATVRLRVVPSPAPGRDATVTAIPGTQGTARGTTKRPSPRAAKRPSPRTRKDTT